MSEHIEKLVTGLRENAYANYYKLSYYMNDNLDWDEMNYLKSEILGCLLLNYCQASITLTNHFLERILKLGLIYNDVKRSSISHIDDLDRYTNANNKYNSKDLSDTINMCCSKGLITKKRKGELHSFRSKLRNGFSHANPQQIFGDQKARFAIGKWDGSQPLQVKEVFMSHTVPFLQGIMQQDFCLANALPFFEIVYDTLRMIEENLQIT